MPSNLVYLGLHFTIGKCECPSFRRRWKSLKPNLSRLLELPSGNVRLPWIFVAQYTSLIPRR